MGKKIENYCLENSVGEGEFGKVYRAVNEKTEQVVAVKVIRIEKFKMSPKLEEFTINEIQTLSKIEDTTHIVKFIEILKTANNYYFVYDYCNGGTLEQEIKQLGHFSEEKALAYFKELLKAFRMLIKKNIMHRDVKPSNILLHNGILKLADFGFCKPLKDARDLAQTMLGSPIYMAPEILNGEVYTMKADIWSLGVVLYEMLFGFCPFEERTIARLISLIDQSTTIEFPSDIKVSKKVEELIRKMLVKDQFKRISWDELFEFSFKEDVQEAKPERERNPFMKKQFNSINFQEERSVGKPVSAESYSTKSNSKAYNNDVPQQMFFKRTDSAASSDALTEKVLSPLIQERTEVKSGVKLVQELLSGSSSKLTVHVCCFLMKKVKEKSKQLLKRVQEIKADKENCGGIEMKKVLSCLGEEKLKLEGKFEAFDEELKNIVEPQDIVFMRYAEEEGLTQEKEGLLQLLRIDDYLQNSLKRSQNGKLTKKELLEEYEKRISRKN